MSLPWNFFFFFSFNFINLFLRYHDEQNFFALDLTAKIVFSINDLLFPYITGSLVFDLLL